MPMSLEFNLELLSLFNVTWNFFNFEIPIYFEKLGPGPGLTINQLLKK